MGFVRTLDETGLRDDGSFVVLIHGGYADGEDVVFDSEFFVPVTRGEPIPSPYTFVPALRIGNCVSLRYEGPRSELLEAENAMYEYIRDSGREPVTGIYRIYENEFFLNKEDDDFRVTLCLGTRKTLVPGEITKVMS